MNNLLFMIVKRVALGVLTLILLSLLIFLSVEALPGDLAQEILGQQATPEAVAAIRSFRNTKCFIWFVSKVLVSVGGVRNDPPVCGLGIGFQGRKGPPNSAL